MKVVQVSEAFGLDRIELAERPEPEPGPGQVRLAMRAASINYRDLLMVRGHYNPRQPLPLVPCSDGVGVIDAVGPGVSRFTLGARVSPIFAQAWIDGPPTAEALGSTLGGPRDGTLVESMVVDEDGLVAAATHLSDTEAAALPCAAVTAWNALMTHGGIRPGDSVLVLGTGGVSVFACQFATALGARVFATSSSDEKLERMKSLGAEEGLNYREVPDWGKQVRQWTGGGGVDHVVEVGGAGTLEQSLRSVRAGGTVSLIGVLAGVASDLNILPILMRQIRVQGIFVGHRASFEAMNRFIELHELRPVIDQVFPVENARGALEHMGTGAHFGKICLTFD